MNGLQAVFVISLHSLFITVKADHGALQDNYIGCFRAFGNQKENPSAMPSSLPYSSNGISVEICVDICMKRNYTYAALQRDSCFCSEEFEGQLPENNCQAECPGNNLQLCGGSDGQSYSIYTVCATGNYGPLCDKVCHCQLRAVCNRLTGLCPNGCDKNWRGTACDEPNMSPVNLEWYIGCYTDAKESAMDKKNPGGETGAGKGTNTIQFCRQICANFNYTYLGTQYYYDCNCGESYDRYGRSNGCTSEYRCSNNRSQICGGSYANSVYSVCPNGSYAQNCLNRCNCLDNSRCVYRNGSCPKNKCKPGWSGISCSRRDCEVTKGDCMGERETCETVDLKYAMITRCGCDKGYGRKRPWEACSDIDECSDPVSACGADAYNCTNTNGGFFCSKCSEGFRNVNGTCVSMDMPAIGVIVGAVFGTVFALVVITLSILFILWYRNKYQTNNNKDGTDSLGNSTAVLEIDAGRKQSKTGENYYDENETPYANVAPITTRVKNEELAGVFKTLCSTPGALDKEFQSIPMDCKAVSNYGKRKEVKPKNRFKNIIPYDHNRVILSTVGNQNYSDYINASFISGYKSTDNLIATQGPTPDAIADFWRMIFEKHVGLIVMITNLEENGKKKCEKYWPNIGELATFGDVTVSLVSEKCWPAYIYRKFLAVRNSFTLEVNQWHYTAWPDHGVPSDVRSFLAFRRKVRLSMATDSFTMVHCSAGAGRTGSFIAIDYLLEQANSGHVDVVNCLRALRQQRTQMIQTADQYKFVYTALVDQFSTGNTVLTRDAFDRLHRQLQSIDNGKSKLAIQFEMIEDSIQANEENRIISDSNLDAVYVQNSRKTRFYVVTTSPPSKFSGDLWTLCMNLSCNYIVFIDDGREPASFIPNKSRSVATEPYVLVLDSQSDEDCVSVLKMSLLTKSESVYANAMESSERHEVTLLHVRATSSPETDSLDFESLHSTCKILRRLTSMEMNFSGPVIVMSQTDDTLSGFCVAAFNAFDMMMEEDEVDLYRIVRDIRKSKTTFIPSLHTYSELYNVVGKYIKENN